MKIPVEQAKEIMKKYKLNQIIMFGWESETGTLQTATYGKTKKDCEQASIGVDNILRLWGYTKKGEKE